MTQEAFKAWWYNEGSQAPYTHHDCEEHTMRMCEIAWANGAYKALSEHAMREVQRLGQEIEQAPYSVQQAYAMAQVCLDLHDELGCKWGDNPYLTINQLKASPPQRKPLTDEEINAIWNSLIATPDYSREMIARAIEAAHGIKGDA